MNSENSKTSKLQVLILKITNKLDVRMGEKVIALLNLSIYYTWKNIKSSCNNNKLKYLHQHAMIDLNYQMDRTQYQIFKIILSTFQKNMEKILRNHQ